MKIVNIFINCIVIVDVKESTIFYVNGEKVSLNITKEKIEKLYDGFLPINFNLLEDCFFDNKKIEIVSIINKNKSKPIIITKEDIIRFNEKINKDFIPNIFLNLYQNNEQPFSKNQKSNLQNNSTDDLNQYVDFKTKQFVKNQSNFKKQFFEFKSNYSFLKSFELENVNDEIFFDKASKLFTFNLDFFSSYETNLTYWFNFKIIYYALILES